MIWIASAKRTPQGRFLGSLAKLSAVDLAVAAGRAALGTLDPERIDQVIVGNVLAAGQGMNIARQIGVKLGLPLRVPAFTVNMMCASGMQAVRLAVESIQAGNSRMILCGGTESMSNAPHLLPRSRTGYKLGDAVMVDSLLRDGLVDSFSGQHMGLTAERLAVSHGITREAQDQFAATSQQRWLAARNAGRFANELLPLEELAEDEHPRGDTTADKLAALKPTFQKDGSVTAGNASGLNDGAAMLVVCDENAGREAGLEPLALIEKTSVVGCEPDLMGLGPVYATRALGIDPAVFDAIELNEAFAAQALACIRDLELDESKVNGDGGAIALGHPIGATGARLLVHLAHQGYQRSLATLCVGGGMGCAVALRKP